MGRTDGPFGRFLILGKNPNASIFGEKAIARKLILAGSKGLKYNKLHGNGLRRVFYIKNSGNLKNKKIKKTS